MKLVLVIFLLLLASNSTSSFFGIVSAAAAAVVLQNPDFELPPSKEEGAPNASVPVNENNTIPGWTSSGTVQYVIVTRNNNGTGGHAVLLGEDGKINQTFVANGGDRMRYLLTFTLGMGGSNHCATNVSLVVSAPDTSSEFNLKQNYSKDPWQTYAYLLGSWDSGEPVNLVLQSKTVDTGDSNSTTCWPLVDNLLLETLGSSSAGDNNNLLSNGGFELGPAFAGGGGVLLDSEPSVTESALEGWSIIGTIRYVDSKTYFVPEGNAAVEMVSSGDGGGGGGGIQTARTLTQGSTYDVHFMLGDANDSCVGDLKVGVQAGSFAQNITLLSQGTGSATNYSVSFKAGSGPIPISFQSYTSRLNKDGVFCGPLIDAVVLLQTSDSHGHATFPLALFLLLAAALLLLQFIQY